MAFLDKNGLQTLTNKLVQGDAIKVASHRGHTVKNVIDNITRECENISTPNTMNLENRINEFKVGKGRDVDVSGDVEEGKIEVELQGKTWQNLIPKISTTDWQIRKNYGEIFEDGSAKLTKHTAVDFRLKQSSDIKYMIKPNTVYTFAYTVVENYGNLFIRGQNSSPFTEEPYKSLKKGFHIYKLTSKSTITESMLQIYYTDSNSTIDAYAIIKDIILLEGDYTQTPIEELPNYFEGIKSSFEDGVVDIEVQGKNLFNGQLKPSGGHASVVADNLYQVGGDSRWKGGNFLIDKPLEVGKKYTVSFDIENVRGNNVNFIFYEVKPNKVFSANIKHFTFTFTCEECEKPSFIICTHNGEGMINVSNIQITKTPHELPYEPYYKKKISFNIGEPLRSLPNGVSDEITRDGKLIKRVGKIVLDGNEKKIWLNNIRDGRTQFILQDTLLTNPSLSIYQNGNAWCDTLPVIPNDNPIRAIWVYEKNNIVIQLPVEIADTIDKLRAWLSQNPTTVYYELAEPIITPIEPIEFDVKPLATMTINSEIAPISNYKVVLNRAGQIEQGIVQIAELKSRVDALETAYDSYLLETQHKLSILGFEYELESEEV